MSSGEGNHVRIDFFIDYFKDAIAVKYRSLEAYEARQSGLQFANSPNGVVALNIRNSKYFLSIMDEKMVRATSIDSVEADFMVNEMQNVRLFWSSSKGERFKRGCITFQAVNLIDSHQAAQVYTLKLPLDNFMRFRECFIKCGGFVAIDFLGPASTITTAEDQDVSIDSLLSYDEVNLNSQQTMTEESLFPLQLLVDDAVTLNSPVKEERLASVATQDHCQNKRTSFLVGDEHQNMIVANAKKDTMSTPSPQQQQQKCHMAETAMVDVSHSETFCDILCSEMRRMERILLDNMDAKFAEIHTKLESMKDYSVIPNAHSRSKKVENEGAKSAEVHGNPINQTKMGVYHCLKRPELQKLCSKRKLSGKGTNKELIGRLVAYDNSLVG